MKQRVELNGKSILVTTMIREIRTGKRYQDVPWPKEKPLHPDNLRNIAAVLLKNPISEKEDEFSALLEDYHLTPSILAVTMLRLVRRDMAGDGDLALMLMVLGGYGDVAGRIFIEESSLSLLFER